MKKILATFPFIFLCFLYSKKGFSQNTTSECELAPVTYCDTVDVYMLHTIVYKVVKKSGSKNGVYWYSSTKKDWDKIIITTDTTCKVRINELSGGCEGLRIRYSVKMPNGSVYNAELFVPINQKGEPKYKEKQ